MPAAELVPAAGSVLSMEPRGLLSAMEQTALVPAGEWMLAGVSTPADASVPAVEPRLAAPAADSLPAVEARESVQAEESWRLTSEPGGHHNPGRIIVTRASLLRWLQRARSSTSRGLDALA